MKHFKVEKFDKTTDYGFTHKIICTDKRAPIIGFIGEDKLFYPESNFGLTLENLEEICVILDELSD